MNSERRHKAASHSPQVCPKCKQPVEAVVERHKNMAVYVPVWSPGPCRNPRCERYEPEMVPIDSVRGPRKEGGDETGRPAG
ncbi:hypothetical protein ACLGIH_04405 [Streptomyces sp. HMX87]|uniref:hypothetical protein n=1 Tax=Streptomyces sp. HMX87 TaxID=3390849 RepID=UPI003A8B6051